MTLAVKRNFTELISDDNEFVDGNGTECSISPSIEKGAIVLILSCNGDALFRVSRVYNNKFKVQRLKSLAIDATACETIRGSESTIESCVVNHTETGALINYWKFAGNGSIINGIYMLGNNVQV